ncbi:hypothetical protein [Arthrobacter bambusae]|uniref:Transposase n=1 Tax=Arthrobacter bambusae TaxID=1338426 RepID=A0AAW8D743_9MICC|nr:hypothetical protein [Arthrobacter bambusae]MDP9904736.1 hypothetical protein [Arthrobacter bambusae]MDQ0129552.1 hypothetical protein [Arthrobacter bambusae]MDQ0180835.1 hypothetical protein [Arthrobacter bambusae]
MVTEAQRAYNRQYYLKNRDVFAERSKRRYSAKHTEIRAHRKERYSREDQLPRVILGRARQRAKMRGIEFSITLADIKIPKTCPVLGMPLERNTGEGKAAENSPSLDRTDPTKGYVPGNVQVISYKANCMKNNASIEGLLAFAEWVRQSYSSAVLEIREVAA